VVLSALANGIGGAFAGGSHGLVGGVLAALLGWVIWALVTWLIGAKLMPEPQTEADLGQLMRTIGFSASPGILRIFGGIPGLGPLITLAASVWMLAAMVVAVRQALDYRGTGRAILVCLLGFLVYLVVFFVVSGLFLGSIFALTGAGRG
jgi:hypothetical protein